MVRFHWVEISSILQCSRLIMVTNYCYFSHWEVKSSAPLLGAELAFVTCLIGKNATQVTFWKTAASTQVTWNTFLGSPEPPCKSLSIPRLHAVEVKWTCSGKLFSEAHQGSRHVSGAILDLPGEGIGIQSHWLASVDVTWNWKIVQLNSPRFLTHKIMRQNVVLTC